MKRVLLNSIVVLSLFLPLAHSAAAKPSPAPSPAVAVKSQLVDINRADEKALKAIPGVGDVYAKKIIAGRPYKAKNELVSKKVLPEGVYAKVKDLIIAKQK